MHAQNLTVTIESDQEPIPFAKVHLISLKTGDTLTEVSDFDGQTRFEQVKSDLYAVETSCLGYEFHRVDSFQVVEENRNTLTIEAYECELMYPLKECPEGHGVKHVVRMYGDIVISMSFASPRKERRYFRKVKRRGYQSTFMQSQEFIYSVVNNSAQFEGLPLCDKLSYCKKHKIIIE